MRKSRVPIQSDLIKVESRRKKRPLPSPRAQSWQEVRVIVQKNR